MILSQTSSRAGILLALGALASCGKSASPPTDFGVNVTVDARALSAAHLAAASKATLNVVVNGDLQAPRELDVAKSIGSKELRFHYKPNASVVVNDELTMSLDVYDAAKKVRLASGSAPKFKLAATAVAVTIVLEDETAGDGGGKAPGTACADGSECGSGFCADGVCCNVACDDTCVSCNLAGKKGTCSDYEIDTDPEMECQAKLPPSGEPEDAGAGPTPPDAASDAKASEAGAVAPPPDAAAAEVAESDAAVINTPDGGLMSMPKACAGTCGGNKACKFPGKEKSCGKAFCNSQTQVAAFACDGNGTCNIELSECATYACDDSAAACKTQCGDHSDCLGGSKYCNGTTTMCAPKKGNGLTCVNGAECASTNCISGVCCNTSCTGEGLSCTTGQCACLGVTCATGVACQVFYQDVDGDGYGNKFGTLGTATVPSVTAKAGCAGATPAGYVADKTDCDDGDPNAHPGQTVFYGDSSKGSAHTFDYNCDGKVEKETPEYPNGTCKFCGAVGSCDLTSSTCSTANQTASFQCPQEAGGGIIRATLPPGSTLTPVANPELMSGDGLAPLLDDPAAPAVVPRAAPGVIVPPICKVCVLQCCGCAARNKTGFTKAGGVACGAYEYTSTCGACAAAGGAPSAPVKTYKRQLCR